jgi:TetR/AcrR family transcriptional regulator of autoinduction and epiphytic fitness
VRRGEINRRAIVDAALELVAADRMLPTASAVAERAGVAKRSVFHHFPDMDALLASAAETQAERHWNVLRPPEAGLSLSERIVAAVAQRAELFEAIGDVRRVAALGEQGSPVLAGLLQRSRQALRRHVRRAMSPEITCLGRIEAEGVQAISSWEVWEVLRRQQGLTVPAAAKVVETMIESAFERALTKEQ